LRGGGPIVSDQINEQLSCAAAKRLFIGVRVIVCQASNRRHERSNYTWLTLLTVINTRAGDSPLSTTASHGIVRPDSRLFTFSNRSFEQRRLLPAC